MNIDNLVLYLDELLHVSEISDYPHALNGLQVANSGTVSRIAAAVDASEQSIRSVVDLGCDLLLVHHGLFWDGLGPVTGRRYRRLKLLLNHDIAVYASHLPLDVHPEFGNNVLLARELGIEVTGGFGEYNGTTVGICGNIGIRREALAARLDDLLGVRVKLIPGGPEMVTRAGVITGGAGSLIGAAAAARLDAFVTGEGAHHTYSDAMENQINVYYAGHYATETFGVRALAAHLAERFHLPWEFVDLPTGL
jgi:dinuclear metal center YbgI/SA1388 family protein